MSSCSLIPEEDVRPCECQKALEDFYFSTPAFEPELSSPTPGIFTWKFLTQEETEHLLNPNTSKKEIMDLLDNKLENDIHLSILLFEIMSFCRNKYETDAKKTSSLMGIMYNTHVHFVASRWRTPEETYDFFRESLLRHSLESPPTSVEIFEPDEVKEALLFFIELYMRNLPLTRLLCLPHYKLRLKIKDKNESFTQLK